MGRFYRNQQRAQHLSGALINQAIGAVSTFDWLLPLSIFANGADGVLTNLTNIPGGGSGGNSGAYIVARPTVSTGSSASIQAASYPSSYSSQLHSQLTDFFYGAGVRVSAFFINNVNQALVIRFQNTSVATVINARFSGTAIP